MRIIAAILLFFMLAAPARACEPSAMGFEEMIAAAPVIFAGTVTEVTGDRATFAVEKAVKGIKDGESFTTDIIHNTCGIEFTPGQTWLFMGNSSASGSFMLRTEAGQVMADNAARAKEAMGYDIAAVCTAEKAEAIAKTHPYVVDYCAAPQYHGCAYEVKAPAGGNAPDTAWVAMVSIIHSFDENGAPRFMPEGAIFVDVSNDCAVARVWGMEGTMWPPPGR